MLQAVQSDLALGGHTDHNHTVISPKTGMHSTFHLPTLQAVQTQLGIGAHTAIRQAVTSPKTGMQQQRPLDPAAAAAARFVLPLSDCEFTIDGALEELQRDAFPAVADQRPTRCTGTAMQVGAETQTACLLKAALPAVANQPQQPQGNAQTSPCS